jgi:dienelactone hydrolase
MTPAGPPSPGLTPGAAPVAGRSRMGLVGHLSLTVDQAIRWRLGFIPVTPGSPASPTTAPGGDVEAFWLESRVDAPAPVAAVPVPARGAWRGARLLDLAAPSAGPGGHPGSRQVVGRVAVHPRPGAPAVLLLHGYAALTPAYEEHHMRRLLRRGLSAARIDLPFHLGRRVPGRGAGAGFFGGDPAHTRGVLRQATEDAAAVIAWLRRELSPSVGVLGFSLGGLVACLLGARVSLESLVAVTPPCDLAELTLVRSPARLRRELGLVPGGGRWGADPAAARAALARALAPVTPRLLGLRTPGDRVTLVAARHDLIVGETPVRELAAAWHSECWGYGHGHVTVMAARGLADRIRGRLCRDLGVGAAVPGAVAG